ncbi:MAG: SpoIIE family protein phosphatase [Gemmatimonadaceae bacterium]
MTESNTMMWQTQTSLRALRKALLVGPSGAEGNALRALMFEEGYIVEIMEAANEALERLRAVRFDVVLLDAAVQGLAGGAAKFIESLRADPHMANVPVILMGAPDEVDVVERCLTLGADDYLPRAFGPGMLQVRMSAALDRRGLQDNQALRREMDVARNIQRDFLPETLPVVKGVKLWAALHPAKQVSGDFYDAFPLPSGSILIVVGDVCDKGVGAALFMALFRSLIRASADSVGGGAVQMIGGRRTAVIQSLTMETPGELLTRVAVFTNNYIARLHGRTNVFATAFMAVLDPVYGGLDYVNAGHDPGLLIGRDGSIRELRPTGPALGMMEDSVFRAEESMLERGESLLAFTDGLVEALSPDGEAYGGERLRALLRENSSAAAPELVATIVASVKAFARQAEPHDDLTMLAVSRE